LSPETMRECKIVTEISRTVTTKRKDVLIEAFAAIQQQVPNSLLVVSVDDSKVELAGELRALIRARGLRNCVATYVPDEVLPALYAVTDVYCTPSVMEGFGMSAQEAAASGVPVVSSSMVPFVVEYLLGEDAQRLLDASVGRVANPSTSVKGSKTAPSSVKGSKAAPSSRKGSKAAPIVGEGAVVVRADDVDGFARALEMLLTGDELREKMGANAYRITIPYFTWPSMVAAFLERVGVRPGTADADIRL
jgi:glycosyltransferase involved in cell wall biosynthesis